MHLLLKFIDLYYFKIIYIFLCEATNEPLRSGDLIPLYLLRPTATVVVDLAERRDSEASSMTLQGGILNSSISLFT